MSTTGFDPATLPAEQQDAFKAFVAGEAEKTHKAKLAELGYDDHAQKVLAKTRDEAKTHRLERERLDAENKAFKDAEAKRKADEADAKAKADADAKKKADDEKPLKDQLEDIRRGFNDELSKRDKEAKRERDALEAKLKARDEVLVKKSVVGALKDKGAPPRIAELLAATTDLSIVTVEDGEINDEELSALIDAIADDNKDLFKKKDDEEEPARDQRGQFTRPRAGTKKDERDASKMSDSEFAALEAGLRSGRT